MYLSENYTKRRSLHASKLHRRKMKMKMLVANRENAAEQCKHIFNKRNAFKVVLYVSEQRNKCKLNFRNAFLLQHKSVGYREYFEYQNDRKARKASRRFQNYFFIAADNALIKLWFMNEIHMYNTI